MKKLIFILTLISSISNAQYVSIVDDKFEKSLIEQSIDTDGIINGKILQVDASKVKSLDVANKQIENLEGIQHFTNLRFLDCSNNLLEKLKVDRNMFLESLICSKNKLDTLNLENNFNLFSLVAPYNQLQSVILKSQTLQRVTLDHNKLKSIKLEYCPALKFLNISSNKVDKIDFSKNFEIQELDLANNYLISLNLDSNIHLITLNVQDNIIEEINLCNNKRFFELKGKNNKIKQILLPKNLGSKTIELDANTNINQCN